MSHNQYGVLGVTIDCLSMKTATEQILAASAGPARYVTKPYVEFFTSGRGTDATNQILNNSLLCLPDGVSLQWAVTYLYGGKRTWWRALALACSIIVQPRRVTGIIPEKFGGASFTWELLEACAREGKSIYLIGSPHGTSIKQTARTIAKRLPSITISGTWPGKLDGLSGEMLSRALPEYPVEQELMRDIHESKPDIILAGLGFPIQELLIQKLAAQSTHGIFIGEGGTFDYDSFGGHRRRAPAFVRRIGLEWLWRLALEPSRIRRQLAIPRFMWAVYRQGSEVAFTKLP